jgi:hypothetical protein
MTANRDSTSSHDSDLSLTAINPNSSQVTPRIGVAPQTTRRASNSSSSSSNSDAENDVTKDLTNPVEGWPRVALLMAKTPDFAAFSRFRDLNIKSLLYYQAQLTNLKKRLHELEYKDALSKDKSKEKFASRADFLMTSDSEQFKLITEIRLLLKEYNEALLQYSQISTMPEPDIYNMKNFRKWLRHETSGNFSIGGEGEQNTWGPLYENPDEGTGSLWKRFATALWALIWPRSPPHNDLDLISTRPPSEIDGFTRWVACYFIPFYEDFCQYREAQKAEAERRKKQAQHDLEMHSATRAPPVQPEELVKKVERQPTLATWSEKGMLKFTASVSIVVACLLPIVAIAVLSYVKGLRNLLLCLAGFAVIFAVGLIFLTNGTISRVDIFTATAAFSAVLVVFISPSPSPST